MVCEGSKDRMKTEGRGIIVSEKKIKTDIHFRKTETMNTPFNYRHLYYFWMVARLARRMSNAAARRDMAVQTVSTQVRELERDLVPAAALGARPGALTEAGVVALRQAEAIFQLGGA